jgi:hypothetical protein
VITFIFWTIGIINLVVWGFNGLVALSDDQSGKGMVLMVTLPVACVISLVSLVIVGFLT